MIDPNIDDIGQKVVWVGMPGRAPGKFVVGKIVSFNDATVKVEYSGTQRVNHKREDLSWFHDIPNREAEEVMAGIDDMPQEIRAMLHELGGVVQYLYHNHHMRDPEKIKSTALEMLDARAKQEARQDEKKRRAREMEQAPRS